MRISLKDFGGFLSSPELGKRIAVSVLDSVRKEPDVNVIMDFSGVQSVNKHFCEEFLTLVFRGVGYEEFKKKVVMQNQTAVVKMVFDSVISQKKDIPVEGIDAVIGGPIHTVHAEKKEEEEVRVEPVEREVIKEEKPPVPVKPTEEKIMAEVKNEAVQSPVYAEEKAEEGEVRTVEKKPESKKVVSKKKEPVKKTVSRQEAKPKKVEKKTGKKVAAKPKTTAKKSSPKKKK